MKDHVVGVGECLSSIAFENGFFYETLWGHPRNAELRAKRKNPHVLLAGDVVHIPDIRKKEYPCATRSRYKFRRHGVPEVLNLRLLAGGEPRAGVPYTLTIDGVQHQGKTSDDGTIVHRLSPAARDGKLVLEPEGAAGEEYDVLMRRLDPVDEVSGVQARLKNLGFYQGEVSGEMTSETVDAIHAFQHHSRLPASGDADAATQAALLDQHGS
jgi:N-acetylmuramoyl-L-alanine amidase